MVYKGIVKTKGFLTPVWHTFALRNSKNDCGLTKGTLVTLDCLDCLLPSEEETTLSVFYHQIPFLVESEHLDTDNFTLRREGWHTMLELSKPEIEHLFFDIKELDRYGRVMACIYIDGFNVNLYQVQQGMAWAYQEFLDGPHVSEFFQAEESSGKHNNET